MNVIPLTEIYNYDYHVDVINSLWQSWSSHNTFSCIGIPKKSSMILYFDRCSGEYTMKSGRKIYAKDGDIVYAPAGSEYSVRFFDFADDTAGTIGVNFNLYDVNNYPFIMNENPFVVSGTDTKGLVYYIEKYGTPANKCIGRMKSVMYEILSRMSEHHVRKLNKKFDVIQKGIREIENLNFTLSVSEIAKLCNVSEIYFRRLFKEYSGMSPVKYIMHSKIERAKTYLEYSTAGVEQLSEILRFTDSSYFCKQFKLYTGMTPNKYRAKFQK